MTKRQEYELQFLQWFYHSQRLASGNSTEFEKDICAEYEHERGGWFPYTIIEKKDQTEVNS